MLSNKALSATGAEAVSEGITYVGGTTAQITASNSTTTNISLTSLTGGIASQPAADDLVVVYYGTGSTVNRAISVTTSGYTQVAKLYANDTYDTNLYVGYKTMTSTPDTQVTVSATLSTSDAGAVAVHVWRNVDTVLPLDKAGVTATGTNTVLCNPPAITPNTTGAIILAGGAGGHSDGAADTFSSSDLSNFVTVGGPNQTNDVTVGLGSYVWTSGAFDPSAFTFSGNDSITYSWAAVTLALRPKNTGPANLPVYVANASTSQSTTGADTLTIDVPSGTAQGDLMIAAMAKAGTNDGNWTAPTGWTEAADQSILPELAVFYRVAGASEPANYAWTGKNNNNTAFGTILTYRYAAYDTIGTYATNTSPLTLPSVTASEDFSILIAAGARSAASITLGTPTGMTARVTDNDAASPSLIVCEQSYFLAGATGTKSMTTGSATDVAGIMLVIKPA